MIRVLAIDGPAASGKSSTARAVARRIGWVHLDSGALYRGVTLVALELGGDPTPEAILARAGDRGLRLMVGEEGGEVELMLDGRPAEDRIRGPEVTAAVSRVSAIPAVRAWVNREQRRIVSEGQGTVVDGRDIGTVVFPDAPLKVFLDADPGVRARRRLLQRGEEPDPGVLARETDLLAGRDRADSGRKVAPLRPAADAVRLSTDTLTFEEQVGRIVALAREAGLSEGGQTG